MLSIVGSLAWMKILISMSTTFITTVSLITGLSDVFLGSSVLAVGNSYPGKLLLTKTWQ